MFELLKGAEKKLSRFSNNFCIIKEAYILQEGYNEILECIKGNEILLIKSQSDLKEKIEDKSIKKIFVSNEILEKYEYLAFLMVGIEGLKRDYDPEGANKVEDVLFEKISKVSLYNERANNEYV